MYRYVSYIRRGHWGEHKLLSTPTAMAVVNATKRITDTYWSIQYYDKDGVCLECPIFADFDGGFEETRRDAYNFAKKISDLFSVVPDIYFSGNRGFHVVLPYMFEHFRCAEVVKQAVLYIEREIGEPLETLDRKIYTTRRMWRVPGSLNSKAGFFKTKISLAELHGRSQEVILSLASDYRTAERGRIPCPNFDDADILSLGGLFLESVDTLPTFNADFNGITNRDFEAEITPCLQHLVNHSPNNGDRNRSIYILARFFKSCDVPLEVGLSKLLGQPHYLELNKNNGVTNVFNSVYCGSNTNMVGCRTGTDGVVLRKYCDNLCWFSSEFPKVRFSNDNK